MCDRLSVDGVTKFVKFANKAVVVPENQIKAVMRYCDDYVDEDNKINDTELHEGQLVMITSGEMMGLTGRLAPIKNKKRLIVYIESVGQYIPVNISRTKIEPVHENTIIE